MQAYALGNFNDTVKNTEQSAFLMRSIWNTSFISKMQSKLVFYDTVTPTAWGRRSHLWSTLKWGALMCICYHKYQKTLQSES